MAALVVVEQDQPRGEKGTSFSLDEVARRIAKGGQDSRVRAWAIESLERARIERGVPGDTDRQRAEALLHAVQKKLWVPDPVGVEFMAGAHLMACDRSSLETLCIGSGDCDDKVILLGSVLLSVGIYVSVIGHGYSSQGISHVILGVWIDGQWEYADPSTDLPLGTCVKFMRERMLSVPNVRVICDANVCLTDKRVYHPEQHDFVLRGVFVGVDGPPVRAPKFAWVVPSACSTLGQSAEYRAQVAAEAETAKKIEQGGGITNQDAADVAGVAAGAAAAVLCAEGGPIASAACGTVAAAVTQFLTKALLDGLSDLGNSGALPPETPAKQGFYLAMLHNRLFPNEKVWSAYDGVADMRRVADEKDMFPGVVKEPASTRPLYDEAVRAAHRTNAGVANAASAQLIAKAAVQQATQRGGSSKKKSSLFWPIAIAGSAAGGLWWLSRG